MIYTCRHCDFQEAATKTVRRIPSLRYLFLTIIAVTWNTSEEFIGFDTKEIWRQSQAWSREIGDGAGEALEGGWMTLDDAAFDRLVAREDMGISDRDQVRMADLMTSSPSH